MTRDEIIRMAREAGFRSGNIELYSGGPLPFIAPTSATDCMPELERFAALVAAAERAACASICKDESKRLAESANRLDQRGSTDEAGPVRALAWKCNALKERIEDRGKQ